MVGLLLPVLGQAVPLRADDHRDAVDVADMPAGVEFDGYVTSWRPPAMKQAAE